jgi:hypothetical protein
MTDTKFDEGSVPKNRNTGPGRSGRDKATRPPRWRRRYAWVLVPTVPVLVAGIVLGALANSYQPLTDGPVGDSILAYPGLPSAQGVRTVNTFGGVHDDVYIPPQRGTFYLFADVANYGSRAVAIESVSVPGGGPLSPAGRVLYARPPTTGNGAPGVPPASRILRNVGLAAGQAIFVAIPVRSWPCWQKYTGFTTVPNFYVTYRYLFFTHTVAIPWQMMGNALIEVIMHAPGGRPGQPDVVCAGG